MAGDSSVTKEILIEASPEEIFPYLVEGDKYVLWMGIAAELEAWPGGIFRVDPNGGDVISGTFVEVNPPRRVVFTWGWDKPGHAMPAGSTTVEIELVPRGANTLLRLVHRWIPNQPLIDRHDFGWAYYLKRLGIVVGAGNPGPDELANPGVAHG